MPVFSLYNEIKNLHFAKRQRLVDSLFVSYAARPPSAPPTAAPIAPPSEYHRRLKEIMVIIPHFRARCSLVVMHFRRAAAETFVAHEVKLIAPPQKCGNQT